MRSWCWKYLGGFMLLAIGLLVPTVCSAQLLDLKDGDRVVWIGSTVIEREQAHGYWELLLTSRFPRRKIVFRNLAWSGDTVWGESRAGFATSAEGYKDLVKHVTALEPTVIIMQYGSNEAFAGEAKLADFVAQVKTLLKDLSVAKARFVLLAPFFQENLGPPLPNPEAYNKQLWHYNHALHEIAASRDLLWVDLESWIRRHRDSDEPIRLTDNGMHPTPLGYWITAGMLENELRFTPSGWQVQFNDSGKVADRKGTTVSEIEWTGEKKQFRLTSDVLPVTAALRHPGRAGQLKIAGLASGKYELLIDGQRMNAFSHEDLAQGVMLDDPFETQQIGQLRTAIVQKNELYFHRWRPQNVTYLFGFRQREQGNNAVEIPQFDPLVAEQEEKIAELCVPRPHTFEIRRVTTP